MRHEGSLGPGAFTGSPRVGFRRVAHVAIWVTLVVAVTSLCQGCVVVPVRAPTRTNALAGKIEKVNLDFLQTGKTARQEVKEKIGGTDTGVQENQLFLGRWASSKWGVFWAAGGGYNAVGGWNRAWARHNVLISFDDQDIVQQYHEFPDEDLVRQLSAWVAEGHGQPLDLSAPIELPVDHRHSSGVCFPATLVLSSDSFEFRENEKHNFKISPQQIRDIQLTSIGHGDKSDARYMNETIHFTAKTNVGGKMTIRVDVPTIMTLVKYLAQMRSRQQPANSNPAGNNSSVPLGTFISARTRDARSVR
jgi:hypothetical protein